MQFDLKDCVISQLYFSKFGEMSVRFKVKPTDYDRLTEEVLRSAWADGTTFDITFNQNQNENQQLETTDASPNPTSEPEGSGGSLGDGQGRQQDTELPSN